MHRRGQWPNANCPMCTTLEDHRHVISCSSDQARKHFMTAWGALDDWLEATSSPEIGQAVYLLIEDYKTQEENVVWPTWSLQLQATVHQQRQLGPRSFVEGFHTTGWIDAQQEYYDYLHKNKSAEAWATTLTEKVFLFTHTMWKMRCTFLHSKETQGCIHADHYDIQLTDLLSEPPPSTMPAIDRSYFIPLQTALQYNNQRKKRLISQLQTFLNAHAIRTSSKSAQCMMHWLSTYHDQEPD